MPEPKITSVYHWANGMTMVFDQYGKQMPEFQGYTVEMLPKLRAGGWHEPVVTQQWPRTALTIHDYDVNAALEESSK